MKVADVEFVKELYPRIREDDAAIERYRSAIEKLPPITVARGRVLVDGFHRWQAHRREGLDEIAAEDLGDVPDGQIIRESYRRNAHHGVQLSETDKRNAANRLYLMLDGQEDERYAEIADLLSITLKTSKEYSRESRRYEKRQQQEALWDRWLNCDFESDRDAGKAFDIDHKTVAKWLGEFANALDYSPPGSRQHFDVWQFQTAAGDVA